MHRQIENQTIMNNYFLFSRSITQVYCSIAY